MIRVNQCQSYHALDFLWIVRCLSMMFAYLAQPSGIGLWPGVLQCGDIAKAANDYEGNLLRLEQMDIKFAARTELTLVTVWQVKRCQIEILYCVALPERVIWQLTTYNPTMWRPSASTPFVWLCDLRRPTYTDYLRRPVFCRCWPTSVELFANRTKSIWQSL